MENEDVDASNVISRTNLGVGFTTAEEMDTKRRNTAVLDYLCKLDEAKEWIVLHTGRSMDLPTFIEELPKGEWLADIAKAFDSGIRDRTFTAPKKEYLHTDNINIFLRWLRNIRLSRHFYFEVIDLYESKNIPKVIYCIHGLAHFLNMRGITKGISKSNGVFTDADKALIGVDLNNIESHRFEDIQSRLDAEEALLSSQTKNESFVADEPGRLARLISAHPSECDVLRSFAKTLIWRQSFTELIYLRRISLATLRKFLPADTSFGKDSQEIQETNRNIISKFKANYQMQTEKDSALRTVRLLLENQCRLREIQYNDYPLANDYRLFKRVLYNLLHDYSLLYKIVNDGFELPFRVFFPDNHVGDYYFSKFVEYALGSAEASPDAEANGAGDETGKAFALYTNNASTQEHSVMMIAGRHFMTSRVFKNLTALFDHNTTALDLNPVNVSEALYNELPKVSEYNLYNRKAMLDEAIKDKNVREEIARRAALIVEFISARVDYIGQMDLPFYVRMFAKSPGFFESFIEPAILLSSSFIISELVKYIFYGKDLFGSVACSYEQERLTYYNCKCDRTSNFDFTDYSPLKEFLESEANRGFYQRFTRRTAVRSSVNDAFAECIPDDECMQVEVCLEEVNNIIIILKESQELMGPVMKSMTNKMTLLRQPPAEEAKAVRCSDALEKHSEHVGVVVGDVGAAGEKEGAGSRDELANSGIVLEQPPQNTKESSHSAAKCAHTPKHDFKKDKFILKLDTEFIDLDNENAMALDMIMNSLKARICLVISISAGSDLLSILGTSTTDENVKFEALKYPVESLNDLKRQILDDMDFLASKEMISRANGFHAIVEMIASDIVSSKCSRGVDEYRMNVETLDALFKKGQTLRAELNSLYNYLNALFASMATNKSGVILNRQCAPHSRYGTYSYGLSVLKPWIFEDIDASNMRFTISMEEPLVVDINVLHKGKSFTSLKNVRFDELLRLREDGIACFDVNEVMSLNVSALIGVINDQYINY